LGRGVFVFVLVVVGGGGGGGGVGGVVVDAATEVGCDDKAGRGGTS
jgi:hypothetical protein